MRNTNLKIVADRELPFVRAYFEGEGRLYLKPGRSITRADVLDADVLLVRSLTRVDEGLLGGTSVKWVGTVTTGVDHLDTAWLDQAGIGWQSAAGYNAQPVAEYVLAVIAALQLQKSVPQPVLRVGVVGVGQVGARVAALCQELGFPVLLCDPPRAARERDFPARALAELVGLDLVTVHTPLTAHGRYPTQHLINAAFLNAAQQKGVLLNTSRGGVVDAAALRDRRASGWTYCFDVWEGEPEINLESLRAALLATPHVAGYSVQCRYRGIELIHRACCAQGFMSLRAAQIPEPPRLRRDFGGAQRSWQEVVLALFDPRVVTEAMKLTLLKKNDLLKGTEKCATLFDTLRSHYIGDRIQRHEFGYTTVSGLRLEEKDRSILTKLGITIEE